MNSDWSDMMNNKIGNLRKWVADFYLFLYLEVEKSYFKSKSTSIMNVKNRSGYVYIFVNTSMPGLIKVGKTKRNPTVRAKELRTTGVPTPFIVAFELHSDNCDFIERSFIRKLKPFRKEYDREFFNYPLKDAINLILKLAEQVSSDIRGKEILQELKNRFKKRIREDIVSMRIFQNNKVVWLEEIIAEENLINGLSKQVIRKTYLDFITDEPYVEELTFAPNKTLASNAKEFINLDAYSLAMLFDFFTDEGNIEICEKNISEY